MILWMYDTSRDELVYNDPQAGPVRFGVDAAASWTATGDAAKADAVDALTLKKILTVEFRRNLPRANRSELITPGVRFR